MFDDLKQNNQSGLDSDLTSAQTGGVKPSVPSAMDDMFADTDPVADKLSAVQSGRIRPISNTRSVPAASTDTPVSPPATVSPVAPKPEMEMKTEMVFSEDRYGRARKWWLVIIGVFLAVGLAVGVYVLMNQQSQPDNSSSVVNTNNSRTPSTNSAPTNSIVNQPIVPPVDPDDLDDDRDGLSNGEEKKLGTNPLLADTDNDRLFDQDEVEVYQTNPLINDSDNDGLADYEEVVTWLTDPAEVDTDGDTFSDGTEVANGYNPLGAGTIDQWSPPAPEDLFNR